MKKEEKDKVNLGVNMNNKIEEIRGKANRCLNCKIKPCSKGCPLENDIPSFIGEVKKQNYQKAYEILTNTTFLPSICGRICPHMSQCMGSCIRGIKHEPVEIGKLEAFIGDWAIKENYSVEIKKANGKKIAVIGGGPSGLTCSAFLAREGFEVTIFEKYQTLGGILSHGIPEFRLEREILEKQIQKILELGIKVEYGKELGKNLELKELEKNFDVIYLALGANSSSKMKIEGENLEGVLGGNQLLENNLHPDYTNKKVAVIGGGNVAMDTARTIKKLGAKEVEVIYRRARKQMPAETKEIEEAEKEGITFRFQTNIIKILGNQKVEKIECIQTQLVKKEGELREVPVNVPNSNYLLDIDYVVMAVGSHTKPEMVKYLEKEQIQFSQRGYILVNENYQTTKQNIFAGGDVIGSKATVAWAARAGREAAKKIIKYCGM
jgi:glutamate synthase